MKRWLLLAAVIAFWGCEEMKEQGKAERVPQADFYVATDGNDAWSGKLPAPNAAGTDGPFATPQKARDAVRAIAPKVRDITVIVRGGTYHFAEPLALGMEDSGNPKCTVSYTACPGEKVVLSGGRPIEGWRKGEGHLYVADIPDVKAGKWTFKQLFVNGERQIRARYPNLDPADPIMKGWLFIREETGHKGSFRNGIGACHTRGDWAQYRLNIPADGDYRLWLYYGAHNKPYGRDNMNGRIGMGIDGAEPVPLTDLPDTGSWRAERWGCTATLKLKKGERVLKWQNLKGGGINLCAWALCNDANWTPKGTKLAEPAKGKHMILFHAEMCEKAEGKDMTIKRAPGTQAFKYGEGDLPKTWANPKEMEVHIFPAWGWVNAILTVDRIDPKTRSVHIACPNSQELRLGNRYYFENVAEELDMPGEWHLDRKTGRISYWPKDESFAKGEVVAPVHDRVIEIKGDAERKQFAGYIRLSGFTIAYTGYTSPGGYYSQYDAAVHLEYATNCTIDHCTFVNTGGHAAVLSKQCTANRIERNEVDRVGQGGFLLTGSPEEQPTKNVVTNNHIHHCGQIYKHVSGVYMTPGSDNVVSHNLIHHMPRYGISMKVAAHRNVLEYNRIHHANLETNDTGAIETLGRDKKLTGNIIRYNMISDVIGLKTMPDGEIKSPFYTWGIYLDDYSSGTTITGNIVYRTYLGGVMLHGGWENLVENNVLVEGKTSQIYLGNIRKSMHDNKFFRNVVYYTDPEAVLIRPGGWVDDPRPVSESDHNLYWHDGKALVVPLRKVEPEESWEAWKKLGYDKNSVIADPRFVDPKKDDYTLKPDSPAFKLGFKQIPVEKIGIQPE